MAVVHNILNGGTGMKSSNDFSWKQESMLVAA